MRTLERLLDAAGQYSLMVGGALFGALISGGRHGTSLRCWLMVSLAITLLGLMLSNARAVRDVCRAVRNWVRENQTSTASN